SGAKVAHKPPKTPKILIIEDDRLTVHLIESQLTASGYEVVSCDQPERALEIAADLQPQAITLDLLIKQTSGWEILLQLKNDPRTTSNSRDYSYHRRSTGHGRGHRRGRILGQAGGQSDLASRCDTMP